MNGKTRFAPSPTGYLHEGHILSALYVWAYAEKLDLQIHLRIEDHDQSRARKEYIQAIYDDLKWMGFSWHSKSIQSEHFYIYENFLEELNKKNLVYPCYCSRKDLEQNNPKNHYGEIIYKGTCLDLKRQGFAFEQPHSIRIEIPDKVISWHDERLGFFFENPKLQCGDFPIQDREHQWTYQFAVTVDDMVENITHIVRGEDILSSTARQIALSEIIGRKIPPKFFHHPLITDNEGKKLSKREKSYSIREDRELGISPEKILGKVLYKAGLVNCVRDYSLNEALFIVKNQL